MKNDEVVYVDMTDNALEACRDYVEAEGGTVMFIEASVTYSEVVE